MKRGMKRLFACMLIVLLSFGSALTTFAETESLLIDDVSIAVEAAEAVEAEAVDVVTDESGTEGELGESIDSNLLSGGAGAAIHYDANGGKGTMTDDSAEIGSNYTVRECGFTKEGHELMFWIDMSGPKRQIFYPGERIRIEGDFPITLKAFWVCSGGGWVKTKDNRYYYEDKTGNACVNDWARDGSCFYYLSSDVRVRQ